MGIGYRLMSGSGWNDRWTIVDRETGSGDSEDFAVLSLQHLLVDRLAGCRRGGGLEERGDDWFLRDEDGCGSVEVEAGLAVEIPPSGGLKMSLEISRVCKDLCLHH